MVYWQEEIGPLLWLEIDRRNFWSFSMESGISWRVVKGKEKQKSLQFCWIKRGKNLLIIRIPPLLVVGKLSCCSSVTWTWSEIGIVIKRHISCTHVPTDRISRPLFPICPPPPSCNLWVRHANELGSFCLTIRVTRKNPKLLNRHLVCPKERGPAGSGDSWCCAEY